MAHKQLSSNFERNITTIYGVNSSYTVKGDQFLTDKARPTFKAAQLPHKLIGSDIVMQKVREGSSISSLVEVEGELCCVCVCVCVFVKIKERTENLGGEEKCHTQCCTSHEKKLKI
ncbi:hypothetical protein CFP56_039161 [Quercus suber]|uniref:Uncharacterized protein n=1 Tax=Quercus suber TaxID=58331 RepID=A0AAW0J1F3_QUESU